MRPIGLESVSYTARQTPLLPLSSVAALVYPIGGIGDPSQDACAVGLQVVRKRDKKDGHVIQDFVRVALGVLSPSLSETCSQICSKSWTCVWLPRQPDILYRTALSHLGSQALHSIPEDWDEHTMVALANEVLQRSEISAPGEFIAACERSKQARHAFALALAALHHTCSKATWDARPAGHQPLSTSWYGTKTLDAPSPEGMIDLILGTGIGAPHASNKA